MQKKLEEMYGKRGAKRITDVVGSDDVEILELWIELYRKYYGDEEQCKRLVRNKRALLKKTGAEFWFEMNRIENDIANAIGKNTW